MAADESTPLIRNATPKVKPASQTIFGPGNRILLAGFMMAFTLGITQVPILYVFRLMECDVFYSHNPPFEGPGDRCSRQEINAGTAMQFSILGMSTSFSAVLNLFVSGYFIKLWGPRWAFVSQTSLLGLRVSTQILGVTIGGRVGILVFQVCQSIGVVGGPRGYQLVLNTAVSEIVAPKDRTAVFGRLQGSIMMGTAFGFLLGGVLGDVYGIRRPSSVYGALFLPEKPAENAEENKRAVRGIDAFFAPIKVIVPHKYRLENGGVIKNYGMIFLALGIFLSVFASGYAPILLQMYASSEFGFGTTANGWLMSGNSLIRGLFLIFMFPKIITSGRIWYNGTSSPHEANVPGQEHHIPTNPEDFDTAAGEDVPQEPITSPEIEEEDTGTEFDLFFVRWSMVVDSIVTFFAGFSNQGWQVYLAAFLLPFASGSAPAVKGVLTEMCPPRQRVDALSAITMVESSAMLTTQGIFGLIFAAFAERGQPRLTFFCNAACALLGVVTLFLATFPPLNSKRIDEDEETESLILAQERSTQQNGSSA
ncbi:uncharacterized protein BCR38DRAFT_508754 [Pseudomassariella vexata]|uniref:Major facilitator superfamily domain-containing protein n=1 Tax=Pseudomassariella vexata TaxID=1141098 RepID=A0A1Y2D6M2_9PEZI|nr:uncharacterized protein BCR38DRAFT_508754 [Pseudomassariella vexata]ORY54939.1 hypothetical protein BCR38DRAFT_508754 [Pseudomassariella vexata]